MNGLQQFSQALCYTGGYVLVSVGLVDSLDVFKYVHPTIICLIQGPLFRIIQAMHLGSTGMTAVAAMKSDFVATIRGL